MNKINTQCEVCREHESKYTCPRCSEHTCSLDCFKKHKIEKSCSGLSDASLGTRDSYVNKKEMKMEDVQRDYNFLLKVNRSLELTKRKKQDLKSMVQKRGKPQPRRNFSQTQGENARPWILQRGVRVMKAPFGMERGRSNKSSGKGNNWSWTVEWLLVDSQMQMLQKYVRYRSNETATLKSLIPEGWITTNENGVTESYTILLKDLDQRNIFVELSPDLKLSEAFHNRLVLEYPTVYISKEKLADNSSLKIIREGSEDAGPSDESNEDTTSESDSSKDSSSSSSSDDDSSSESDTDAGSQSDGAPEESSSKVPVQEQEK